MATPALTSDLVAQTRVMSGLLKDQRVTDSQIAAFLSDALVELADDLVAVNERYFLAQFPFTMDGSSNTVTLPSDFLKEQGLDDVTDPNHPRTIFALTSFAERNGFMAGYAGITGPGLTYDIVGGANGTTSLVFYPVALTGQLAGRRFVLYYVPQLPCLYDPTVNVRGYVRGTAPSYGVVQTTTNVVTWTFPQPGNFNIKDVGRYLSPYPQTTGTVEAVSKTQGLFLITSVPNAYTVVTTGTCTPETITNKYALVGDSYIQAADRFIPHQGGDQVNGTTWTMNNAVFNSADVGRYLLVTGTSTSNGLWQISSLISSHQVATVNSFSLENFTDTSQVRVVDISQPSVVYSKSAGFDSTTIFKAASPALTVVSTVTADNNPATNPQYYNLNTSSILEILNANQLTVNGTHVTQLFDPGNTAFLSMPSGTSSAVPALMAQWQGYLPVHASIAIRTNRGQDTTDLQAKLAQFKARIAKAAPNKTLSVRQAPITGQWRRRRLGLGGSY